MPIAARPSHLVTFLALLGAASLGAASPAAAQDVDTGTPPTVPNWPIFPFGRATAVSWATLGQSFIVPVGETRLDAFTFWLRDNAVTGSTPYHAYVFDWDPATRRTGASYLYRSAAQDFTGAPTPTPVSFSTGGLDLVAGQSYIAVLSSVEFPNAPSGLRPGAVVSTNWPNDGYAGGMSYTRPGPAGLGTLTQNPWFALGGTGDDLAFRADFSAAQLSPVPEPTTVTLLGVGALGVALVARRRRLRG
jgi:hypothetical protein